MPRNTDFTLQMAVSHATFAQSDNYRERFVSSANSYYQTFVKVPEGASADQIEAKFPAIIEKYLGEEYLESYRLHLQPLSDVHYNEAVGNTNFSRRAVSKVVILIIALIGLLIMITACVNFVNLSTARAVKKAKEVGVRKVLGSYRRQLIAQFLTEAFLIVSIASVFAAIIAVSFLEPITNYLAIPIDPTLFWQPDVLIMMMLGWLLISLLPGIYPALLISRFKSLTTVLNSSLHRKQGGGLYLRKGLIVFQFAVTFFLIISTGVVVNQLDYIRNETPGIR